MLNAIYDPQIVQNYYSEYLNLIKFYINVKRPGVFVRYYNIDVSSSTYDEKLETTYDLYTRSNIRFNLYDFTPSYYLAPIVNASANTSDLRGQMLDATSSIVIYTLTPRIHDLVMFYDPVRSGEIFRVTNFRTPVNALHTNANLTWFEMDLEYAPISDIRQLRIQEHFVYDLAQEKYITYNEYQQKIKNINEVKDILNQIKEYYDTYYDLYQADYLVPIEVNELLIFFKRRYGTKFNRLFDDFWFPYGYLDLFKDQMFYQDYSKLPYVAGNYKYRVYSLVTNELQDYVWSITYKSANTSLDKLFLLSYQLLVKVFDWNFKDILDQ